ncbi:membrane lipoprotein lipid attachment site-containing protein [Gottfriedia acidiceleris]|uniref:membrane lipoprotein lipid attachment site-containing protein n=1 Tax=Gottfriedia acidiceleris TaxID=371036 RepID=UPI003D244155
MKKIILSFLFVVLLSGCNHHAAEDKLFGKWSYHTKTTKSNEDVDYLIEFKEDKKTHVVLMRYTTKMGSFNQTLERHYKIVSSTDKQVKLKIKGTSNILTVKVTDKTITFLNQTFNRVDE